MIGFRSSNSAARGRSVAIIFAAGIAVLLSASQAVSPAAAEVKLSQCQRKHADCSERCIMRSKGENAAEQANACIKRTCDKQNPGCGPDTLGGKGGSGTLVDTKPKGNSKAAGVRAPRGTGVFGISSRPSNQNPANVKPRGPGSVTATGIFIR